MAPRRERSAIRGLALEREVAGEGARVRQCSQKATGLQTWVGTAPLPGIPRAIVARSVYYRPTPAGDDQGTTCGELLEWSTTTTHRRIRLPGEPLLVGDLRGAGKFGILIGSSEKGYSLWEP